MRNIYKKISTKSVLMFTALLLMGSLAANAQIVLPGGGDNNIADVPAAPIDGFLSIGLIAGAAIGLRKKIKGLTN